MNPSTHFRSLSFVAASIAALVFAGCAKAPIEPAVASPEPATLSMTSVDQKVSYGIGQNIGRDLASSGDLEVDLTALLAGLEDGMKDAESRVPQAELQAAFMEVQQRAQATAEAQAVANRAAALTFLEQNRQRPGVTTTGSGLQYEVMKAAPAGAAKPTATNTVRVHYHGTLPDGTVFDSSVQRGQPVEFPVNGVIPGWVEALQLMSVGSKWKLFIPPALGYGDRATGAIPAGAALVFEVELLEIK